MLRAHCEFCGVCQGDRQRRGQQVDDKGPEAACCSSRPLVSRHRGSRHNSRAGHPASRRCSSLTYAQ